MVPLKGTITPTREGIGERVAVKPYLEYARYVLRIFRIIVARKCIVNLKKRNNFSVTFQGLVKISIKSKKLEKEAKVKGEQLASLLEAKIVPVPISCLY